MSAVYVEAGPDAGALWHSGNPFKETRALAEGLAWADLSHLRVVAISGEDRLRWLHDLTTQHLQDFAPNTWSQALILDPQGHIEYQFLIVDDGARSFLILDAPYVEGLMTYLNRMKFMLRVDVRDASDEFALLRAPGVTTEFGGPYMLVARQELEEIRRSFAATATEVGTWALDALRVEEGRPRIGFETDYKTIPNELGLLNSSVHMNKGCYRGQETVAKVYNLGKPPRRLVMLHLDGSEVDIPPQGAPVELDGVAVGFVGTVARHYELGTIALAVIKRTVPIDATLTVAGIAASQQPIVSAS